MTDDLTREDIEFAASYDWKVAAMSVTFTDRGPQPPARRSKWAWLARPLNMLAAAAYWTSKGLEDVADWLWVRADRVRRPTYPNGRDYSAAIQEVLLRKQSEMEATLWGSPMAGGINRESAPWWKGSAPDGDHP